MVNRRFVAAAIWITLLSSGRSWGQQTRTIFNDADATVRIICRNNRSEAQCLEPLSSPASDDRLYIRAHDQNQLETGYWHFNLSELPAAAQITEAKFQLDTQTNSWGDTYVTVVAITDPSKDWDLNALPEGAIIGANSPQSDYDSFAWTGDPDNVQRFNAPTPFLGEGETAGAVTRRLVPDPGYILNEDQDPVTSDETNPYGGYAGDVDGDGVADLAGFGSADEDDNIWPTKNAVDLDITDLVKWKLGQNPAYSDFNPTDRELSIMVRTEFGVGDNGFVRFISNESDENAAIMLSPPGAPALLPGRIIVTFQGAALPGDFDHNGSLELADVNALGMKIAAGTNDVAFDLNIDQRVNQSDLNVWVNDLKKTWIGDSNLDGEFNTGDLVAVFQAGRYEQDLDAGWDQGDWTGDRRFGSGDLVAAFQDGGFEKGPRAAVASVPEPSAMILLLLGVTTFVCVKAQ